MAGQNVSIVLQHKLNTRTVSAPVSTTFGNLRELAEELTGIPAAQLKLLFRGREKSDSELLMAAGVKNGSRINIVETASYRESQPDSTAGYSHHQGYGHQGHGHQGQFPAPQVHASASAHTQANHRAPETWEQFSSEGPSQSYAYQHSSHPNGASVAHAHSHAPQAPPHQPDQGQARQSRFDATPHTSPRPSPRGHPQPATAAAVNGTHTGSPPQPQPQSVMDKIAAVQAKVDQLSAKAEGLLREPVIDRKALRLVEEQFTQQLLALDSLEVSGDERSARKVQINRINLWADRLEGLRG